MSGSTDAKWAFVGDLQIPYHDPRAVELWFKAMKWWSPDIVDIVGDIDDQLEYSTFSDGTTDEFFNRLKGISRDYEKAETAYAKMVDAAHRRGADPVEIELLEKENKPVRPDTNPLPFIKKNADGARDFYTQVANAFPGADRHVSLGNHDIRVFNYVDRKAPEYNDAVTPNTLWGLDDLGFTWRLYHEKPLERYAGIYVHHGATVTSTGLAVRGDIEAYNVSLVRGHDHRGGVVYKSYPMTGNSLVGMGTGHMCDADAYGLQYALNPSWEQGFGIAHLTDGKAHLQFIPIRNTQRGLTCVVDGKAFTA